VEELGLANARDIVKMLRWNDKYGIKFLRLSSEMFPFASHLEYGYKLTPFASEALAEAGRVVAELGHRVSTHPGQFTQLGSPRSEVISNSIRDLEYHDELLSLLKLPPQENRDAVMILHMGGTFGDKATTLDRFRANYQGLSLSIKMRLVLENDDVSWSVHDLLPICEELNVPLCLDFHHHNIIFDSSKLREGTLDIMSLFQRIKATWDRKGIRQKMHYSEPTSEAITGRQRRKHNSRPATLPPCSNDMDLMIEAKDKEQAVFELMRTFKLPGWDTFNNIIPYERTDDNKPLPKKAKNKKTKKQIAAEIEGNAKELSEEEELAKEQIDEEEVGMGGPDNRVYWPPGMEEWLRPKKRVVQKKGGEDEEEILKNPTPANFAARQAITTINRAPLSDVAKEKLKYAGNIADIKKILEEIKAGNALDKEVEKSEKSPAKKRRSTQVKNKIPAKKNIAKADYCTSKMEDNEEDALSTPDLSGDELQTAKQLPTVPSPARRSGRSIGKRKSYFEDNGDCGETEQLD
jgi:UV DNA damage endonuclease